MKKLSLLLLSVAVLSGCTRVDTGHVGVRKTFNGTIELEELDPGFHQNLVGSVKNFVATEMTLTLANLQPQTKDRSSLEDLDLTFTYSVNPEQIADLTVRFKGRDAESDDGWYPMGAYMQNVVRTAAADVISNYEALIANEHREEIRDKIKIRIEEILKEEKLDADIEVHQIFINNLHIAAALQESAQKVIVEENNLKAKRVAVQTAEQEALRLAAMANKPNIVEYMNAKANADIGEAVLQGKVATIVVPHNFTNMLMSVK